MEKDLDSEVMGIEFNLIELLEVREQEQEHIRTSSLVRAAAVFPTYEGT